MPKRDHAQQNDTEIHVETRSEQTIASGCVSNDDSRVDGLTADLQRLQAEFLNYKRRAEAEKAELFNFAKNRVTAEFLAVRDNFDRELAHRPETIDPAWATSIDTIRNQFDQVLKGQGVERFDSVGQLFDPNLHEAIARDGDGDIVTEEFQPGYRLGDTVLRHAMVKVGRK